MVYIGGDGKAERA